MKITEVRVKLVSNKDTRLKAFCSMTLDDDFTIRDIKVIESTGAVFVAMPSRKITDHCEHCGSKNHLRAKYCNYCGAALAENRARQDAQGRMKLHIDIAHPINTACRRRIQDRIVAAYHEETARSAQPGYKPVELDESDDDIPEEIP